MSLNKLVGGDCGGNNALVQLSSLVNRDGGGVNSPQSQVDRYVHEFMAHSSQAPQTFNMNALLNNMPQIDITREQNQKSREAPSSLNALSTPWLAGRSMPYMPQQSFMQPMFMPNHPFMMRPQAPSNVQVEYLNESDLQNVDVRSKAQEYINMAKDDDNLAYNQFMSFMKRLSAGEVMDVKMDTDHKHMSKEEIIEEMAEKYKDEWAKLSEVQDYWDSEVANGIPQSYNFTEGNVMLENKSALEIGKEKLKMGDVPGAVLCFEAAVQQQPESAEAWFLLGTTQAENEQDPMAISALKKTLEIDPRQLEAYITLAAAYTNENMSKYAFMALLDWLKASPKYSDMLPQDVDPKKLNPGELEDYVKSLYLKAAMLNPELIDSDVQNALGVIFNISQEYAKAVDCFRSALVVASNDSKIWNRLGATLANSEKSAEAVEAYHQALNLEPGFIRARYNVGITCMNLGAYRQAAEHFLVALNQQMKARNLYPESSKIDNSSSTIWTTLRMVCSFMGEHDMSKFVDDRNLDELNKFFEIQ